MGEDESVYRQIVHPLAQQTLKSECGKLTDFTKTSKFFFNCNLSLVVGNHFIFHWKYFLVSSY